MVMRSQSIHKKKEAWVLPQISKVRRSEVVTKKKKDDVTYLKNWHKVEINKQ